MRKLILLFVILNLFQHLSFAQNENKIDSLQNLLKTAKEDTNKVNHLNNLCKENLLIGNYDTAIFFGNASLKLAKQLNFKKGFANSYNSIGVIYKNQGNYSESLKNHLIALKIRAEIGHKQGIADSYNNIGVTYMEQGNYPEALENFYLSLKISEEIGDKQRAASSYSNIGIIHRNQGNGIEALKNYFAALKISKELGNKQLIANLYNNIGNIYGQQLNYSEALINYNKSLKIREEMGSKKGIATAYGNIGAIYNAQKNYPEALKNQLLALEFREAIGDNEGITNSLINLGKIQFDIHQIMESRDYFKKSLRISMETGRKEWIKESFNGLSQLDSIEGNWQSAYKNYKSFILYRDSLLNEENTKKTVMTEMNYEFEKKEAQAKAEQDKKDAITAEEKQRQKLITYSVSGGLFLVLLLALFIFRGYKQKQKANVIITQQKNEVEKQKQIIEEKNKDITDSITYAKRLQTAILPPASYWEKYLPQSFVLFQPKDIVSGDFYWLENVNDLVLFAAADCTGHGVSGAMVSVVCSNALNRTVKEFGIIEPAKILDKTRELVLETFEKSNEEVKDGMDISLCCLNTKNYELLWSGANNPLWYIRENNLFEIKGDKQPIGQNDNPKPFTTHSINLQQGDTVYIFSDGYADQFGGEKGKKFMYKPLKELLLSIQNKSIAEQQKELHQKFTNWKKNTEQTDDVLVIGFKI